MQKVSCEENRTDKLVMFEKLRFSYTTSRHLSVGNGGRWFEKVDLGGLKFRHLTTQNG